MHALSGCDAAPAPSEAAVVAKAAPGIHVLSRPTAVDTIEASLVGPLVLEIRGQDSLPMRGAMLNLGSILKYGDPSCPIALYRCIDYTTLFRRTVGRLPAEDYSQGTTLWTDAKGRVSLDVLNGRGSGAGGITVIVRDSLGVGPTLFRDTIPFTVLRGNPFLTRISPYEIALSPGRSISLTGVVLDRGGALLDVPPPLETNAGAIISGLSVQAVSLRDGTIIARYPGTIPDTSRLRIVPSGRVAGIPCYRCTQIVITDLDGTNRRTIELGAAVSDVDWTSDGSRLIVAVNKPTGTFEVGSRLVTVDASSGAVTPFATDTLLEFAGRPYVLAGPDGDWVYLSGVSAGRSALRRIRLDGTGLENLVLGAGSTDGVIGVSPDGRTTTYVLDRPDRIGFLDIRTYAVTFVDISTGAVGSVRWNPSGTLVAFAGPEGVGIMRPDGSDQRFVASFNGGPGSSLDWSPDGRWIITDSGSGSVVIEVSSLRRFIGLPAMVGRAAWYPK